MDFWKSVWEISIFQKKPILTILEAKLDPHKVGYVTKQAYHNDRHGKSKKIFASQFLLLNLCQTLFSMIGGWFFKSWKFKICQYALHIFWNILENKLCVQNHPFGSIFKLYAAEIWFFNFYPWIFENQIERFQLFIKSQYWQFKKPNWTHMRLARVKKQTCCNDRHGQS